MKIFAGMFGGLLGAAAMHLFRLEWERFYPRVEDGIFGFDWESDVNSVQKLWPVVAGRTPTEAEAARIAMVLHYGIGVGAGAMYGAARGRVPGIAALHGAVFGLALWMVGDELGIGLSGVSDPMSKSWKSHVSATTVHLLYGVVLDQVVRLAD